MKHIIGVAFLLLAAGLCAYGSPQYFVFNLAATGVANADADTTPFGQGQWYGFHGGLFMQHGDFSVNLGAQTSDSRISGNQYIQNVPFSIAPTGTADKESWSGYWATGGTGSGSVAMDLANNGSDSLNTLGTQVVFLMMNTFWGSTNASAEIHLRFSGGGEEVFTLAGNVDVRDHNHGALGQAPAYTTIIDSDLHGSAGQARATVNETTVTGFADLQGEHRQSYRDVVMLFVDSSLWQQRLTGIQIVDTGKGPGVGVSIDQLSRLWLWGVTVAYDPESVPEPSTWMMLAGGLALAALRLRRR